MSYWTHVNGAIRVDSTPLKDAEVKNLFKTCSFYGTEKEWAECNVPRGSEGSVEVSFWLNPNEKDNRRMVITIFGDLRGYEEHQHEDFILWLNELIEDNTLYVSDGIITLNEKVYRYDDDLEIFVLICKEIGVC